MSSVTPGPSAPVERKVTAATAVSLAVSVLIAVLNHVVADADLLGSMPAILQGLLITLVPPVLTFLGGYQAPHTPRATRGDLNL